MRGEDNTRQSREYPDTGSPPHARGRRLRAAHPRRREKDHPACAGKTPRRPSQASRMEDHPRMRGEDSFSQVGVHGVPGSPPHARGRLASESEATHILRITPACAGKTSSVRQRPAEETDHPRMRGEDAMPWNCRILTCGSPPHARGRPSKRAIPFAGSWITPACAGKTH